MRLPGRGPGGGSLAACHRVRTSRRFAWLAGPAARLPVPHAGYSGASLRPRCLMGRQHRLPTLRTKRLDSDADGFLFGVKLHGVVTHFAAPAGLLVASEG